MTDSNYKHLVTSGSVRWLSSIALAVTLLGGGLSASPALADDRAQAESRNARLQTLRFDIAENADRFVFDAEPLDEDELPAYGNEFITEGYLYPHGFLNGREGVLDNGEPAFPDEVLGRWTCRGWHVGEGAKTESGPVVITTQLFDLGRRPGSRTIVTEGFETVDVGEPIRRAITGGTGRFALARGDSTQRFLGFNASQGVNIRVVLRPRR